MKTIIGIAVFIAAISTVIILTKSQNREEKQVHEKFENQKDYRQPQNPSEMGSFSNENTTEQNSLKAKIIGLEGFRDNHRIDKLLTDLPKITDDELAIGIFKDSISPNELQDIADIFVILSHHTDQTIANMAMKQIDKVLEFSTQNTKSSMSAQSYIKIAITKYPNSKLLSDNYWKTFNGGKYDLQLLLNHEPTVVMKLFEKYKPANSQYILEAKMIVNASIYDPTIKFETHRDMMIERSEKIRKRYNF